MDFNYTLFFILIHLFSGKFQLLYKQNIEIFKSSRIPTRILPTKLACFVQRSFKNIFNTEYAAQLRSRVQNVVYHFEFSSVFLLPGVKCRQLDFSCLACQMCAFFWQLFFLYLSFFLFDSHAWRNRLHFLGFICKFFEALD